MPVILVVEDEAMIRMMLVNELEIEGFKVIEAENADAGMAHLLHHPNIDLVVTDIRMRGSMDGLGLSKWMRDHSSSIPIVISSGFATIPDIAAVNPAKAGIVAKPYQTHEIANVLRSLGFVPSDQVAS